MPEAIVEVLEVVEVNEQDRDVVRAASADPFEGVVDAVLEEGAVGESGERVVVRQVLRSDQAGDWQGTRAPTA